MAEITRKVLSLSDLETNTGQLEGVPSNPRQWTLAEVDKLAKSLKETPELLTMRAPIVTPCGEKYVVLGGKGTAEFFDFPFLEEAQKCAETYHKTFGIEVGVYRLIYKREKK